MTSHPLSTAAYDHLGDSDDSTEIPDDPRLLPIVREYLARLEAGEEPTVDEYVAQHPDLAEALRTCLEGLDLVHRSVKTDRPPVVSLAASSVDPPPFLADPLGDFRIVRELGRGGMGVVYEALQTSLGRRVALKVLPFTATLQPRQLQRFLNEAQAAAHLHHPHIVPVFAVGCDRGVHYYAMQLIDGMSLAELLTRLRRDAGWPDVSGGTAEAATISAGAATSASVPAEVRINETMNVFSSRLSTERTAGRSDFFQTVARIGKQAAEALAYAHELGIVHRDIKPANLMIDGRGQVWVTDFGLAQVRSGAELTQTGDLLGTLRYMSPEQVQGDRALLDQRTDIYSLGATLYELATLQPPFIGANRETLLRQVLHEEPVAPRMLNSAQPIELETIIMKALSKSSADRYASAQDLADDLQRFLDHKPILAQRPTLWDRGRKWARRHPAAVIAAALLMAALSLGLGIHNRLIAREQTRTSEALHRERDRAIESERRFKQARQAVDLLIEIGEEELADKPHMNSTRKRLLEAALVYYQDFIAQSDEDPQTQQELAAVESRVKRILHELSLVYSLSQVMLIAAPDVQSDLRVSEEQRQDLTAFLRDAETQRDALFAQPWTTVEERQRQFVTLAETLTERLRQILTGAQRDRLQQIALQEQGLFAFQEPDVVKALALTPEQRRQIREIGFATLLNRGPRVIEVRRPLDGPPRPDGFPPPDGPFRGSPLHREQEEQRQREALQKVLALLTPAQLERWHEMTGPRFVGRAMLFPPGFPGGGPPFREPPPPHEPRPRDPRP